MTIHHLSNEDKRKLQSALDWKRRVEGPLDRLLGRSKPKKGPVILGGGSGQQVLKIGTADAEIAYGAEGVMSVYRGDDDGNPVDTGDNIDVWHDWMAEDFGAIAAGKKMIAGRFPDEGVWRVIEADCPDPEEIPTVTAATLNMVAGTSARVQRMDATSNAQTVNLPAVSGNNDLQYYIVKVDSSANAVTIDAAGSETINGSTTVTLTQQWDSVTIVCDGTEWTII